MGKTSTRAKKKRAAVGANSAMRRRPASGTSTSQPPDILHKLDPHAFEHLVNALALRVLGPGLTFFCSGPDGGRDGFFQGSAPYPSLTETWGGSWFVQSKFHQPGLSGDPQKWLQKAIRQELKAFANPESGRNWPDNWIVATNIDPSGSAGTGTFDVTRQLVRKARRPLAARFHIWGGRKIAELLAANPDIADKYGHFLTPGNVLAALREAIAETRAADELVLKALASDKLLEHQATRLEEAGSETDTRPPIHRVFVDLPFKARSSHSDGLVCEYLARAQSENHTEAEGQPLREGDWLQWVSHPARAPVWFIKGGPGHGKSTIGQFVAQVHRAALVLSGIGRPTTDARALATEVQSAAKNLGLWPLVPRLPIVLELKKYAQWLSTRTGGGNGLMTFLAAELTVATQESVSVAGLRRLLKGQRNLVVFDGLDEVPSEQKDEISNAIKHMIGELRATSDLFAVCTSRPQGYSGQFANIPQVAELELVPLPSEIAMKCAATLLAAERHAAEAAAALDRLQNAFNQSEAIAELMRTPLQVHIMCVIVRSGHRPPERRWALFNVFYNVIRLREANRNLPDHDVAIVLQRETKLLKDVHARLGFVLHARAETAKGAEAQLNHADFASLVQRAVEQSKDEGVDTLVATVMRAARDRLVLINSTRLTLDGCRRPAPARSGVVFCSCRAPYHDGVFTQLVSSGFHRWGMSSSTAQSGSRPRRRSTSVRYATGSIPALLQQAVSV